MARTKINEIPDDNLDFDLFSQYKTPLTDYRSQFSQLCEELLTIEGISDDDPTSTTC